MKKSTFKFFAVALLLSSAISTFAQGDYASIVKLRQLSRGVSEARQMNDAEHFTAMRRGEVVKCSYLDADFEQKLFVAPMGDFRMVDYFLSPSEQMVLIAQGSQPIYRHSYTTSYHLQKVGEGAAQAILTDIPSVRDASFSPNNSAIAFSSLNNLYLYNIASGEVDQITTDGEWNKIINGTTDWVYEEELGFTQAYWFSPDGSQIAYLKFDESQVPLFEMMRYDNTLYNKAYSFKYPKAGDTNSTVELWVYDVATKTSSRVETKRWDDQYIPYVGYTPAGELYYFCLNRLQNDLRVMLVEEDGTQRPIYEEQSPRYIERVGASTLHFIDDERFIALEETTTGFLHLYLHSTTKGRIRPITSGEWEVTSLIAADDKELFYLSTEGSPLRRWIYSLGLIGRGKKLISGAEGF